MLLASSFNKWPDLTWEAEEKNMSNIFYIIGVVVVVLAILGYLGLR
jgi:hypothetical protein